MESSEPELPKPPPPDETSFQKKYNSTKLQKQASDRLMKREPVDIFFSLRFHDHGPMNEAKQLQQLLKEYQINACIVDAENAEDVELLVSSSIAQSKLVVIFGTRDYGTKTTINYSTHNELTFVINERKPFFLIKMCGEFDDSTTRFRLPSSIKYDEWNIGQPVPDGLLEKIIQKFIACNSM